MPDSGNGNELPSDFRVIVRVFPGATFLSITQHGITKRVMTSRKGLREIRNMIDMALDNPMANVNGDSSRAATYISD